MIALSIIILLVITSCFVRKPPVAEDKRDTEESYTAVSPLADYGPLTVSSLEELNALIQTVDPKEDKYNLNDLKQCYIPSDITAVAEAVLSHINIEASYVCLYYNTLPESIVKQDSDEAEIERLSNTIKLAWVRTADGSELLKNDINDLRLKQLDEEGYFYYFDIIYPSSSDKILGKSIFWVKDGLEFNLDIPIDLFNQIIGEQGKGEDLTQDGQLTTETVDGFTAIEKVDIG